MLVRQHGYRCIPVAACLRPPHSLLAVTQACICLISTQTACLIACLSLCPSACLPSVCVLFDGLSVCLPASLPASLLVYLLCVSVTVCGQLVLAVAHSGEAVHPQCLQFLVWHRNWMALYEKLGGDNEASRMMGRATQSVASHFATQTQIDSVSCKPA